jgi:hypothetical protein
MQGTGEFTHQYENYTAWRLLAQGTWVGSAPEAMMNIPWIAADLQEFYRIWLLPCEQHLLVQHAQEVGTVYFPAGLIRKLATERTQDSVLRVLVTQLSRRVAQGDQDLIQGNMDEEQGVLARGLPV